jgi:multidrug resistance efflux pump
MENENNFDKRSKDVQEILGTPPGWLLRYGTLLFFVIIVILIWLTYWIQYPDVVENEIIISFNDPPTKLISPKTGYIDLIYTVHNQRVKKGQLLVSYKTDAYYKDVLMIHEKLSKIKTLDINKLAALVVDENIRVGELQNDLLQFLEMQKQYIKLASNDGTDRNKKDLQKQILALENGIQYSVNLKENTAIQIENLQIQLKNEEAMVKMDKLSQSELNKTRDKYVALFSNLNATEAEIKDKHFKINNLKSEMITNKLGEEKGRELAILKVKDSFILLKSNITKWVFTNLIISPSNGVLQITNSSLKSGQFVNKDEQMVIVIPAQSKKMKGIMNVPFTKSGNIEKNQKVLVSLKSFPSAKYGVLKGRVVSISRVAIEVNNELVSPVIIYFQDGLVTSNGYKISKDQELSGTGRIITEDKRFIQRLF